MNFASLKHTEAFISMEQGTQRIVNEIMEGRSAFTQELQIRAEAIVRSHEYTRTEILGSVNETRAAIIKEIQDSESRSDEQKRRSNAEAYLLNTLAFTEMNDRYEAILGAHEMTFDWIFRDPSIGAKPWSNFNDWLRSEDAEIYWISGRAGSGKSTLMKYISEHPQTHQNLSHWAGTMPYITAGFFFWNSGAVQQRTQAGLLRKLLYEILRQRKDLIPLVMPEQWKKTFEMPLWSTKEAPVLDTWTISRLQKNLSILLKQSCDTLKIMILIDGLDEHDSHHEPLIDLIRSFASNRNVKVCVSSRPLLAFEEGFEGFPSLELHDLTYDDIKAYVGDRFGKNNKVAFREPKGAETLVEDVVEAANGVFLWVRLVVDSLLAGLKGRDRISTLQQRLRELPKDIEGMYGHMLQQVDNVYLASMSQIFQLVRVANESNARFKYKHNCLYCILLSYAVDEDLQVLGQVELPSAAENMQRCEELMIWLKTRCAGLLEVQDQTNISINLVPNAPDWTVTYIHRTARDYLEKPAIWADITQKAKKGFSAHFAWLKAWTFFYKIQFRLFRAFALDYSCLNVILRVKEEALLYLNSETELISELAQILKDFDVIIPLRFRHRMVGLLLRAILRTRELGFPIDPTVEAPLSMTFAKLDERWMKAWGPP